MERSELREAAKLLADFPRTSTKNMHVEDRIAGIDQMLEDLARLASQDGCIAAGWALEFVLELVGMKAGVLKVDRPAPGVFVVESGPENW